jgi:hypothetical protein
VESVGVCRRCGGHVCEVCRTRWRGDILCAACVDRAFRAGEAAPEQARSQERQARLSLVLGGAAWLASASGLGVLRLAGSQAPVVLTFAVFLLLAAGVLAAACGVGQAVAALRTRGEAAPLATAGLVLGGLYVGLALGAGTLFLWQS